MKVEVRANGTVVIEGYVNAVGRDSRILTSPQGKFVEQVEPGTFKRAIVKAGNVRMLLDHDSGQKLADTESGTLTLHEDSIGLYARGETSDESIRMRAQKGELRGWSFGFLKPSSEWENETRAGVPRRILTDFDIDEVSVITRKMTPCYAGTSVEVRSGTDIEVELRATVDVEVSVIDNYKAIPAEYDNSNYKRAIELLKIKQY